MKVQQLRLSFRYMCVEKWAVDVISKLFPFPHITKVFIPYHDVYAQEGEAIVFIGEYEINKLREEGINSDIRDGELILSY